MAYSPPVFNLVCGLYSGPWLTRTLRDGALPCNLAMGRRVQGPGVLANTGYPVPACPCLLVPAGTDIRDFSQHNPALDFVEVPAGSGRWYQVQEVDDVAKGFDNEYRLCSIAKICDSLDPIQFPGLFWPTPMP